VKKISEMASSAASTNVAWRIGAHKNASTAAYHHGSIEMSISVTSARKSSGETAQACDSGSWRIMAAAAAYQIMTASGEIASISIEA